jgi:hypothetical protein
MVSKKSNDKTMRVILNFLYEENQPIPERLLLEGLRNTTPYSISNIEWLSKIYSAENLGLAEYEGKNVTITPKGRKTLEDSLATYTKEIKIMKEAKKRIREFSKQLAKEEAIRSEHDIREIEKAYRKSLQNWVIIFKSTKSNENRVTAKDVDEYFKLYMNAKSHKT